MTSNILVRGLTSQNIYTFFSSIGAYFTLLAIASQVYKSEISILTIATIASTFLLSTFIIKLVSLTNTSKKTLKKSLLSFNVSLSIINLIYFNDPLIIKEHQSIHFFLNMANMIGYLANSYLLTTTTHQIKDLPPIKKYSSLVKILPFNIAGIFYYTLYQSGNQASQLYQSAAFIILTIFLCLKKYPEVSSLSLVPTCDRFKNLFTEDSTPLKAMLFLFISQLPQIIGLTLTIYIPYYFHMFLGKDLNITVFAICFLGIGLSFLIKLTKNKENIFSYTSTIFLLFFLCISLLLIKSIYFVYFGVFFASILGGYILRLKSVFVKKVLIHENRVDVNFYLNLFNVTVSILVFFIAGILIESFGLVAFLLFILVFLGITSALFFVFDHKKSLN